VSRPSVRLSKVGILVPTKKQVKVANLEHRSICACQEPFSPLLDNRARTKWILATLIEQYLGTKADPTLRIMLLTIQNLRAIAFV
jgi:hypothetical protein